MTRYRVSFQDERAHDEPTMTLTYSLLIDASSPMEAAQIALHQYRNVKTYELMVVPQTGTLRYHFIEGNVSPVPGSAAERAMIRRRETIW